MRLLLVWGAGGIWGFLLLVFALNSFIVACFSGSFNVWCQMWCYLVAVLGALLMPWLISCRNRWAVVPGSVSVVALLLVLSESLGRYDMQLPMDGWIGSILCFLVLWGSVAVFLFATIASCIRSAKRIGAENEQGM